ncbi:MAG TPA: hypothetical protein V6D13_13665 [Halomicronema sp.]
MKVNLSPAESENLEQLAYEYLLKQEYEQAISLYEQAIENSPQQKSSYWYLGLSFLLAGKDEEANTTWLCGMMDGEDEEIERCTAELVQVLDREAVRFLALGEDSQVWLLREHLREVMPTHINNLLLLVQLAIKQENLAAEDLTNWGVISLLQEPVLVAVDKILLMQTLQQLFDFAPLHPLSLEFAGACVEHLKENNDFSLLLMLMAAKIHYSMSRPDLAISLVNLCLKIDENYHEVWAHLCSFYIGNQSYIEAIKAAKRCYELSQNLIEKIYGNHQLIRALMSAGGYWNEACLALEEQESLLLSLIENPPAFSDNLTASRLLSACFFFPYIFDAPQQYRVLQNQVARLCQSYLEHYVGEVAKQHQPASKKNKSLKASTKLLKIGYISHCFNSHSVGWLARSLFKEHDRQRFELYGYFLTYKPKKEPVQEWYEKQMNHVRKIEGNNSLEIAQQIVEDEIDILIDLDSLTLDTTCEVMSFKPAPVQVSWLGWDASGLPTIDYYIADPYVLPDSAQEYYTEKIWRLPDSYIAVDGFEVGLPTLRREDLEIPKDAVVYFTGQTGYKRHRETAKLQLKIIKAVSNSYLLIKGLAEAESIRSFFTQLAEEEGVGADRLRFVPLAPSEQIHRANLALADVVLDTFPYNGATTTLETLWVGVPLVTRVGQQFAARNSYTMMVNVGVTEGIAWTDEEYIEWGIRLGNNEELRKEISWKLWQSRKTSPLWNGKQFTREMEKAYEGMWQRYLHG